MKPECVYIAGPMTGIPDWNFPAFNAAAKKWRIAEYRVINPAENFDGDTTLPYADYLRCDLQQILTAATIVAFLPGWEKSKGARLEYEVARALGLELYDAVTMDRLTSYALDPKPETVLEEAQRLVYNDRQRSYGHPMDDFTRTAGMWTGLFHDKLKEGESFGAEDIPLAMICVKLSREMTTAKRDNAVDIAGYAGTLALVRVRQQQQEAAA